VLALGRIKDPPVATPYGDLYLELPPIWNKNLGAIPSPDGVLLVPVLIPAGAPPGYLFPLQALIGPLGGTSTRLTNLVMIFVE